jgi:hypothetical protein
MLQGLEGYASTTCVAYSSGAWRNAVAANMRVVEQAEKDGRVADMLACDCRETPRAKWTFSQKINCPRLGVPALRTATPPGAGLTSADIPTADEDWDHLADTVERAYLESQEIAYLGLADEATTERTLLADPHLLLARKIAFAGCRRDASQKPVAKLLAVAPGFQAIKDDGQFCATELDALQKNATGTVLARLSAQLGGVDAGQTRSSASLDAVRSGTLSLSGPIAQLYCPPGATGGEESLVVKLDGTSLQTSTASPYLFSPLDIDLAAALEAAHPGATAGLTQATLTIERAGAPCGGYWGASPTPLLSLDLSFGEDRLVIMNPSVNADTSRLVVLKLDAGTFTPVFDVTHAQALAWYPWVFLRNQNQVAVSLTNFGGWGIFDSTGHLSVTDSGSSARDRPTKGSHNGKYRIHVTSDFIPTTVVYDNATQAPVEYYSPSNFGAVHGPSSVGPAGEILYRVDSVDETSSNWFVHRLGVAGSIPLSFTGCDSGAFGVGGDKVYLHCASTFVEVDLGTGATRTLTAPLSIANNGAFVTETGGILYLEGADVHRVDIAANSNTIIGTVPLVSGPAELVP